MSFWKGLDVIKAKKLLYQKRPTTMEHLQQESRETKQKSHPTKKGSKMHANPQKKLI